MSPALTFTYGLILLVIFGWYVATDLGRRKRILGTVLTVLLVAFCIQCVTPPQNIKDSSGKIVRPGKIHLGLDLQGGTSFLIRLNPPAGNNGAATSITKDMVDQAVEAIRKRVDQYGVSEPVITPEGSDRILVQIPGLDESSIADVREQLRKVAKLEFKLVYPHSDQMINAIQAGQAVIPPGYAIETLSEERSGKNIEAKLLVKRKADLQGSHVTHAGAYFDSQWNVGLEFDSQGGEDFARLTKQVANENSAMAIVLDGKVISAPSVDGNKYPQGIIGNRAQISGGNMDEKSARNLASALQNPLQTPVVIEEERGASPTLGSDSIHQGIYAGLGGLALVLVFVVIYYRFAGLVAVFGLVINVILLFGAMAMFGFVLTLPGIAGVILTIGLAVDANVLIYERLREELATGKSLPAAVDSAYEKAFSVIFDANATTLITAAILFWKASGPVKGFAVTLTVGIIASVFSAMIVTRTVFGWALEVGFLKKFTLMHIPWITDKNHDFMGKRFLWIGISATVIVISAIGFTIRGDKNFGIDFKGGDLLLMEATQEQVTEHQVREAIEPLHLGETVIQKEHETALNKDYISIKAPFQSSDAVKAQLQKALPQAGFKVRQEDKVGKLVGGELAHNSVLALGLGMLGILIYVTARFEFSFAIGALVALLHDIIITIGLFAIFGKELSLVMVGAILTIAGYSINDTIVVYDRIREGLHSGRKGSIQSIMNASINETLSRTLLTSGCTFLSVAALFFFGGPVLHDFAFAILIGIIVGTYSSIFIASPIVLWWSGRKGDSLKSELSKTPSAPAKA